MAQISTCSSTGTWYTGDGTYYGGVAGGSGGHCSLYVPAGYIFHAALNTPQYANSSPCGTCVRILGPSGEITVKIVDECPSCSYGDIDLAIGAFPLIANPILGRVKIKWQYVRCPLDSGITILFDPSSNPYYFKAQFSNALYPIEKLEYRKLDGTYAAIPREIYNYYVAPSGIDSIKTKNGPYIFRLTSSTNQVLITNSIHFSATQLIKTGLQFSPLHCKDCAGILDGTAEIDLCGVCSGGTTGIVLNSSCKKDCAGVWEGTAYMDGCGTCVSGTTGRTPCDQDCNHDPGGLAYIDNCGTCVGGKTGKQACAKDCNNRWGGSAVIDSCGKCAGGTTGLVSIFDHSICNPVTVEDASLLADDISIVNPFHDELKISAKFPTQRIQLYTIFGTLAFDSTDTVLDTSELPVGIYLIYIQYLKYTFVRKLIKN